MGVPSCLSALLRNARRKWNFQGYVTSDTDSIADATSTHHYTSSAVQATALALTEGQCDVNSGATYQKNINTAVTSHSENLIAADVDRALFNTLKQRFDLGLFDPYDAYDWPTRDDIGTDHSNMLNLQASRESIVLLRNDFSLLPLRKHQKVAVIGPHATSRELLVQPYPAMVSHYPARMVWCPDNSTDCIPSPFQAISAINNDSNPSHAGGSCNGWTKTLPGCDVFDPTQAGFASALALATQADYVILALGTSNCGPDSPISTGTCYTHGSTADYTYPDGFMEAEAHDRVEVSLPPVQQALSKAVFALNKPTVVFLLNAGALEIDTIAHRAASPSAPLAIIDAMWPGPRGAQALAEGIFGDMNSWGRLPFPI